MDISETLADLNLPLEAKLINLYTTLCLDFGNTRLKYAVFDGDQLRQVTVMENDSIELIIRLLDE